MIKKIVGCVRYFGVSTIQSIEVVALPCLAIQLNDYIAKHFSHHFELCS